jgi:hypothetical protein
MPRGLSWQQRAVLNKLATSSEPVPLVWFNNYEPAYSIQYDSMDDRDIADKRIDYTMRRSIAGLVKRGLVKLEYHWFDKENWVGAMWQIEVRYHFKTQGYLHSHLLIAASLTEAGRAQSAV